jgi:hypothetical protein
MYVLRLCYGSSGAFGAAGQRYYYRNRALIRGTTTVTEPTLSSGILRLVLYA